MCYQLFDMMPSDEMNVVRRATACSLSCEEAMSHGKTVDSAFTISEICDASMDHETPQSSYCWKFRFAPHLDYNISEIKVFLKPVSTCMSTQKLCVPATELTQPSLAFDKLR